MSFLNPLFFWGALAAAVPIVLHLIRRERSRKVEFPTLMYLRKVSKKTIRFQKLRHLLLLLLRVLAFLLLALAFTRPFREIPRVAAAPGKVTTAHIILLDTSLSMAYGDRWDKARSAAAEIVRAADAGDKLALLIFADRVTARSQLIADKASLLAQIERGVELTDQSTRYSQALKVAEKLALEAGTGKRVIHLISDFQKSGWDAEEQDARLSSLVEVKPVDVGSDDYSNLAFGEVNVLEADESTGAGVEIKASVMNFGTQERKGARVSLSLDGRIVADKRVDVTRSAAQGVEFQLAGLTPGLHSVVLEVEDPGLARDNRFRMALEARGKTPVLSVETPGSGRGGRSPSFFLAHALNVSALSPYRLATVSLQQAEALHSFSGRIIIWNNAPGGKAHKKLEEHVKGGGGLIVVAGDAVSAREFNNSFGSWLPVRIDEAAPAQTRSPRAAQEYALLTDARMDHPVFRPFSEPHSGSFSGAKFFKYARLKAGQGSEVLARFDNGLPAVVAASIAKGRVIVLAFSADDEGNDLPLKAVFAPFWQQLLRYLDTQQEARRWVEVGDAIEPQKLLAEAAMRQGKGDFDANQAVVVVDPDRQRVPTPSGARAVTVERAGFYEIRSPRWNTPVAVNPALRESDLTRANADELVAGWISQEAGAAQPVAEDERMSLEEQERSRPIWRLLLASVLVFLVSEGLLASQSVLRPE